MKYIAFLFCLLIFNHFLISQPDQRDINDVLVRVNNLRVKGCNCGGKIMPPVAKVHWDRSLYEVSRDYAKYMNRYHHFDHINLKGEDLGDRLDQKGYKWQMFGENLGIGYKRFDDVFKAWMESPSHCKMLMNELATVMGLSRTNRYWVLSMALPLQEGLAIK
jgi:uncharacterized protein YkwD